MPCRPFDSAGQRCSALRVLCVQEEAADRVVEMLQGAMGELRVGNTAELRVDVGPVIDAEAQTGIVQHIESSKPKATACTSTPATWRTSSAPGTFVPPTLIELNHRRAASAKSSAPLHLVRYARKDPGPVARPDQRHRLRPDPGRAHPHRRNHCPRGGPRPCRQRT